MAAGWIKLHRKIVNWQWYTDTPVKSLFVHLILTANHKAKVWKGVTIGRGQLITSVLKLSTDTGLSEQQIRTALKKLKSTNEITIETTTLNTCITVINIEKYNTSNKGSNKRTTKRQQTVNKPSTTTKNVENEKNEKEVVVTTDDPFFEMFRRVAHKGITDEKLLEEIGKFRNRYPSHTPKHSGALINAWVGNMREETIPGKEIKISSFV